MIISTTNTLDAARQKRLDAALLAGDDCIGAILARPSVCIRRAMEWGIDASFFRDPDWQVVYAAAVVSFTFNKLTGDAAADRKTILCFAASGLASAGIWYDRLAEHFADIAHSRWHFECDLFACFRRLGTAAGLLQESEMLARRLAELEERAA